MASSDLVKAKVASLGMALIQPGAGLAAIERLLAAPALAMAPRQLTSDVPVIDVVPFKWRRMLARYQHEQLPDLLTAMADWAADQQQYAPVAAAAAAAPFTPVPHSGAPVVAQARSPAAAAVREQLLKAVKVAVAGVIGREVCACEQL